MNDGTGFRKSGGPEPYFYRDDAPCWRSFVDSLPEPPWSICDHLMADPEQLSVRTLGDPREDVCLVCAQLDLRFLGVCECCAGLLPGDGAGSMVVFAKGRNFLALGQLCPACRATTRPVTSSGATTLMPNPVETQDYTRFVTWTMRRESSRQTTEEAPAPCNWPGAGDQPDRWATS